MKKLWKKIGECPRKVIVQKIEWKLCRKIAYFFRKSAKRSGEKFDFFSVCNGRQNWGYQRNEFFDFVDQWCVILYWFWLEFVEEDCGFVVGWEIWIFELIGRISGRNLESKQTQPEMETHYFQISGFSSQSQRILQLNR